MPSEHSSREGRFAKTLSRAFAGLGLLFMILGGFDYASLETQKLDLPGPAAVQFRDFAHLSGHPLGLWMMSLGILLLAVVPSLRVLAALVDFAQQRRWEDVAAAVIVLAVLVSGAIFGK